MLRLLRRQTRNTLLTFEEYLLKKCAFRERAAHGAADGIRYVRRRYDNMYYIDSDVLIDVVVRNSYCT